MPPLDNPRWERFAQQLVKGKSQTEAYRNAGYRAKAATVIRRGRGRSLSGRFYPTA
jgi:hypothetical protein